MVLRVCLVPYSSDTTNQQKLYNIARFCFSFRHSVKADTLDELVVYYYFLFSKSVTFYHYSHFSKSGLANILTAWQTCALYSKCITKGSTYTDRLLLLLAVCKRVAGLHTFIMSPKRKWTGFHTRTFFPETNKPCHYQLQQQQNANLPSAYFLKMKKMNESMKQ